MTKIEVVKKKIKDSYDKYQSFQEKIKQRYDKN